LEKIMGRNSLLLCAVGAVLFVAGASLGQMGGPRVNVITGAPPAEPADMGFEPTNPNRSIVGHYQAVSDGAGGLLIIDTMGTNVIKHVAKVGKEYTLTYELPSVPPRGGR
jgi:hypothetical protein